jgi:hypothetical protein
LQHLWALGYCFGAFEAFMQRAKLDQFTEGSALLTFGFLKVMGADVLDGDMASAAKLGLALDNRTMLHSRPEGTLAAQNFMLGSARPRRTANGPFDVATVPHAHHRS